MRSISRLEAQLDGRLEQTERDRLRMKKLHAPHVARLALQAAAYVDAARFGELTGGGGTREVGLGWWDGSMWSDGIEGLAENLIGQRWKTSRITFGVVCKCEGGEWVVRFSTLWNSAAVFADCGRSSGSDT